MKLSPEQLAEIREQRKQFSRNDRGFIIFSHEVHESDRHADALLDHITALEAVLQPFVDAYVRADHKESWAASYLNNNAWKRAYKALLKQEQES